MKKFLPSFLLMMLFVVFTVHFSSATSSNSSGDFSSENTVIIGPSELATTPIQGNNGDGGNNGGDITINQDRGSGSRGGCNIHIPKSHCNVSCGEGKFTVSITGGHAPHSIMYVNTDDCVLHTINDCTPDHVVKNLKPGKYFVRCLLPDWKVYETYCTVTAPPPPTPSMSCSDVTIHLSQNKFTVTCDGFSPKYIYFKHVNYSSGYYACYNTCSSYVSVNCVAGTNEVYIKLPNGKLCYAKIHVPSHLTDGEEETAGTSRISHFSNIDAVADKDQVHLNWQSSNTKNSAYYVIEKSSDGENFEALEEVSNTFHAQELAEFANIDYLPNLGDNYYRLQIVNKDGSVEYSNTQKITVNPALEEIALFPNPSQKELFVNLQEYAGEKGAIEVISVYGQSEQVLNFDQLPSDVIKINVSTLNNGIYLLKMKIGEGEYITKQFIVSQ